LTDRYAHHEIAIHPQVHRRPIVQSNDVIANEYGRVEQIYARSLSDHIVLSTLLRVSVPCHRSVRFQRKEIVLPALQTHSASSK